jgi:site-specific recombinase
MAFLQTARNLLRHRRLMGEMHFGHGSDELRKLTVEFCDAGALAARLRRAGHLFAFVWSEGDDRDSEVRLSSWLNMMEADAALSERFRKSWVLLLSELNSTPLFADAGLPAHAGLFPEIVRRVSSRVLPTVREASDAGLLFTSIFSSTQSVARFSAMPEETFQRLVALLWPPEGLQATLRLLHDLRQALRLLATRVAGRGVTAAIRERGTTRDIHNSPFYRLIFATEMFVVKQKSDFARDNARTSGRDDVLTEAMPWKESVRLCRNELDHVHQQMEDAGVSSALVYDLRSIEAALERMELLATVFAAEDRTSHSSSDAAARELINTLVRGRLDDTRLSILFRQNLTLLARKTVERTGHSGEHYVAHDEGEYWQMWRAAAGGGLLTVITAALKLQIVAAHFPLFIEGFLIGTDYAVTFVIMQIFHLALATKQPSMTAAALAGIVRENRGVSRWSKISDYAAQICRTQLAAAFGNVIAVCLGGIVFEELWLHVFGGYFLSHETAVHAYHGMNPLESGTAIFAAFTGVILWAGGLVGGWAENFLVFNRIPEAIVQHPLSYKVGVRNMHRFAEWLERNVAGWSNSIVLGYLLGLSPVIARFFGIPLDVRHVTLNTGMVALAAAQFGRNAFEQGWLYMAAAGVAVTFVLNLGVSFSIASIVALRAYSVPRAEQVQIFKFILKEFVRSPRDFVFPRRTDSLEPIIGATDEVSESSAHPLLVEPETAPQTEPEMTTVPAENEERV